MGDYVPHNEAGRVAKLMSTSWRAARTKTPISVRRPEMSEAASPTDPETAGLHAHLRRETDGRLACEYCGGKITIDPNTGREYGHARKRYMRLAETDGRCPYRPQGVDPHGDFGRSKIHEVGDE